MRGNDLEVAIRGVGALLVLGAAFTWFGFVTPLWGSFVWLGIFLFAGGVVVTGALARSVFESPEVRPHGHGIPSNHATRPLSPVMAVALVPKRCEYCRSKVDLAAAKCRSCGAPL
jgi:hypothetical protein